MARKLSEERKEEQTKNNTNIDSDVSKDSKLRKFANNVDNFIIKYTPDFLKKFCSWLISLLPNRAENWIRSNRFLTICIIYSIRGLFFRPSMWALYAAIAAWFTI
jgi:hypothetical protein